MRSLRFQLPLSLAAAICILLPWHANSADLSAATLLMERQDYVRAEPLLRDVLAREEDAEAEYLLGFLLIETYRFDEAEEHLLRAVAARPDELHWQMVLAKSLLEQGKNVAAGEVLERAIRVDPQPDYYFAHAMATLNAGKFGSAEASLRACLEQSPGHAEALSALGLLLIDEGRSDEAIPFLERARTLNPANTEVLYRLGSAYRYTGRFDEAEQLLSTVVERVPGHVGALHNLARVLIATGDEARANEVMNRFRGMSALRDEIDFNTIAVRKNPQNIEGRLHLATLHLSAGRTQDALNGLLETRTLAPQDARVYRLLADAFRQLGDESNARRAEQIATSLEESARR
jgi:predicted Zn-dependent protease